MNCQADHFQFCPELGLTSRAYNVLKPFHCHYRSIPKLSPVHMSKTSSAQNVLGTEIVGGWLELFESECFEVTQADLTFLLLLCTNTRAHRTRNVTSLFESSESCMISPNSFSCVMNFPLVLIPRLSTCHQQEWTTRIRPEEKVLFVLFGTQHTGTWFCTHMSLVWSFFIILQNKFWQRGNRKHRTQVIHYYPYWEIIL